MDRSNIPENILVSAQKAAERRQRFLDGRDGFTLLFITDVHTGGCDRWRQLSYVGALLDTLAVDFVVNGGDIGLDLGESAEECERVLALTSENFSYAVPHFLCKGNHDYGTQRVPNDALNRRMNGDLAARFADSAEVVFDKDGGGYGSYYDRKTKTLLLFENTSEGDTRAFTMSGKQLAYLADKLSSLRAEENVILFSHYCLSPCGSWRSYPQDPTEPWYRAAVEIERDFVARRAGGNLALGLSWDFSRVPRSASLLCHLSGDSHFNNSSTDGGVFTVVRQGYGGCDPSEMAPGAEKDTFNHQTDCNFDLLVIRKDRRAKLIHVGAGEEKRDLDIG